MLFYKCDKLKSSFSISKKAAAQFIEQKEKISESVEN
jgi:hypothetical protein